MTTYEVIQDLCSKHNIAVTALEKELGFGRGSIGKMRNGSTSATRLQKIADYFNVSYEYLITGMESSEKKESPFTARDERDIKRSLDKFMESLETKDGAPLYYDGNELELTDENKAMLRDALNTALHTVKLINKEKYNPHKNGK